MPRLALLILLFFLPFLTYSQVVSENDFDEESTYNPGSIASLVFKIENHSKSEMVYGVDVISGSEHIIPIIESDELRMVGDSILIYIVPIKISKEASSGKHSVSLVLKNEDIRNNIKITKHFKVSRISKISLSMLNSPKYVMAGDTIQSNFILRNEGNVSQSIELQSKFGQLQQDPLITLSANETLIVKLIRPTDINIGKGTITNLDLTALAADSSSAPVTQYSAVEVIPSFPVADDIYNRFPISASLTYMIMRNRGEYQRGFQGEIYGRGRLNAKGSGELEFRAVSPNPVEFSSFTKYEEYFANYKTNSLFIHVGDKVYSSSFLTEYARYGRGAELIVTSDKLEVGGFYNRPRFVENIKEEFNVFSKFQIDSNLYVTGGYLLKTPHHQSSQLYSRLFLSKNAHLPYAIVNTQLIKGINLNAEAALSQSDSLLGSAFRVNTLGNYRGINFNLAYMYASPKFLGYFNNSKTFNGNIRSRLTKNIDILANYVQDAQNFQLDTLFLTAPYRKTMYYGLNYRYSTHGNFFLYGGYQKYIDRQPIKNFDYEELFLRMTLHQRWKIFNFDLEGQLGATENHLTKIDGNSSYVSANISFEKYNSTINLFGSFNKTSRYEYLDESQIYYGGRIISRITPKSSVHLFYQNNFLPEEYYKDRNLLEAQIHQKLNKHHSIDVSARYILQRGQLGHKDFIASIRYTALLNVPTSKIASYATLSGRVSNLGVEKIGGIRLILGAQQAITDDNGYFTFKNVVPGEHVLEIDRISIGNHDIPNIQLPARLFISDKNENRFDFGLAKAAKIRGRVVVSGVDENELLKFKSNMPKNNKQSNKLIIEASCGETVYRKLCELDKEFDFTYLSPGVWTVKIYATQLGQKYKVGTDKFEVSLNGGEVKDLTVPVVFQRSILRFQQETLNIQYKDN